MSDRAPSSFGEVTPSSTIQLLPQDSIFCRQIHCHGRSDRAHSSFGEERLGTLVVWRGDSAVSDPTSTGRRSGFCRQIHRPGRNDRTPSSFGDVTPPLGIQLLLWNDQAFTVRFTVLVGAIRHLRRLKRLRQNCTIDVFLEKQRRSCTISVDEAFELEYGKVTVQSSKSVEHW
ncbi:hypothetical protein E6C27_scaffold219G00400 [Cucumis melo var. makuwa]|uniref:Uncharacterized protein n=1 Tax=Cucumis melo var. makuwa TaxID=1194695 RepID=A0A5A7SQD3_CUCMM|nr:hypothetical protein E6C27_scaffold219G00400 [Cucumis melo var. makuwa]